MINLCDPSCYCTYNAICSPKFIDPIAQLVEHRIPNPLHCVQEPPGGRRFKSGWGQSFASYKPVSEPWIHSLLIQMQLLYLDDLIQFYDPCKIAFPTPETAPQTNSQQLTQTSLDTKLT
jgi:hypothetical protein